METQEIRENTNSILSKIIIFLIGPLFGIAGSILYQNDLSEIVRNVIVLLIFSLLIIFMVEKGLCNNLRYYMGMLVLCGIAALLFGQFPFSGWCFLAVFVGLTLYSDKYIGLISGVMLLAMTMLITGNTNYFSFLVYLIPGLLATVLFSELDENFHVVVPLIVTMLFQYLLLVLSEALLSNEKLNVGMFLIPAANITVSAIIILILLKRISYILIYESHDRYMDINDPEFELLSRLKEYSKSEYDHTVYTAVLCSKLAYRLKLNSEVCKACAYYHNIGVLAEENNYKNCETLLVENSIPEEVISLIREYLTSSKIISKECGVLLLADAVITSVGYIYEKDPSAELDFNMLINAIVDKKIDSGILDESLLSLSDMKTIRQALVDERLFYDFLR